MKRTEERSSHARRKYRVDFQVFFMTAVIVIISCGLTFLVCYRLTYGGMLRSLAGRAESIHDYVEHLIDGESFQKLNTKADEKLPLYQETKSFLERVRAAAGVRYLYTAKEGKDGRFIYLVDGLSYDSTDFCHIGDLIEPECIPDMKRAMSGEVVLPDDFNHTSWGEIFIAYYPIHEGSQTVGVLGIEFDAASQYETFRKMSIAAPVIICLFCMIAALIAVMLFRRISNPAYKDMANTDLLTGLKNRNAFEVDLNNLEVWRRKDQTALVSIDLDGLKAVNDTHGHAVGDEYIREGSRILQEGFEGLGTLYRVGGDEFAVICHDMDKETMVQAVARVETRNTCDTLPDLQVKLSAGYAFYNEEWDQSLEDTYRRADAAMYGKKREKYTEKGL